MQTALTEEERRAVGRKARRATLDALKALGGEGRREEIRHHALEHGGFTGRELAEPAPPERRDKHRSFVEYRLSWTLTNLKREGLVENPRWSTWALVDLARTPIEAAADQRISEQRLRELRSMSHPAFLTTPEWRTTRAAMLRRAGGHCQLDASHTGPLEVHHNTYERKGVERAADLVVLCADCHGRHHDEPEPALRPVAGPASEPFVVPLDWTPPEPTPRPSLLKRLFAR